MVKITATQRLDGETTCSVSLTVPKLTVSILKRIQYLGEFSVLIVSPAAPGTHHMHAARKPRFMGSGIYMSQQFDSTKLKKGDWCWDADFGEMTWNGTRWLSTNHNIQ